MHTSIRTPRLAHARRPRRQRSLVRPSARHRARRGRLLIECLIAAVLLNATALVVASAALGLFGAAQLTANTTQSWAAGVQHIEIAAADRCHAAVSSGVTVSGGRRLTWADSPIGGGSSARDRRVDISSPASPFASSHGLATTSLRWHDAWECP